ncbi:hypothetical protein ES703_36949 [subsurface metagenome]
MDGDVHAVCYGRTCNQIQHYRRSDVVRQVCHQQDSAGVLFAGKGQRICDDLAEGVFVIEDVDIDNIEVFGFRQLPFCYFGQALVKLDCETITGVLG